MRFVAIDFETANHRADSPCQVAIVTVEDGRRVSEHSWLIRPRDLYFSERCIAVHGIRPRDVLRSPEWDLVWQELAPLIDGQVLVAHNAQFDINVLMNTLALYDLACPRLEYQCTRLIARRCWPGRTGYGLKPTAEALGIEFQHHIAVEDARACAEVAISAAKVSQADSMESLEEQLSISRGVVEYGVKQGPKCVRRSRSITEQLGMNSDNPGKPNSRSTFDLSHSTRRLSAKQKRVASSIQVAAILEGCGATKPLQAKHVVLTGCLLGLAHPDAVDFLEQLGAVVDTELSSITSFWIKGSSDQEQPACVEHSSVKIISQRQLLAMIPGGLRAVRMLTARE